LRRSFTATEGPEESTEKPTCKSLAGRVGDLFLRRESVRELMVTEKKGRGGRVFIVSALRVKVVFEVLLARSARRCLTTMYARARSERLS
jgi:hypothetical protein